MAKKYVTKKTILKAIETEPLASGHWVEMVEIIRLAQWDDDFNMKVSSDKNCTVCAVGAVLRQVGLNNKKINEFGESLISHGATSPYSCQYPNACGGEVKEMLTNGLYLHALSVKFEDQAERTGVGKRTRKVLSNFVKANFPNRIELNPRK